MKLNRDIIRQIIKEEIEILIEDSTEYTTTLSPSGTPDVIRRINRRLAALELGLKEMGGKLMDLDSIKFKQKASDISVVDDYGKSLAKKDDK